MFWKKIMGNKSKKKTGLKRITIKINSKPQQIHVCYILGFREGQILCTLKKNCKPTFQASLSFLAFPFSCNF